MPAGLLDWGTSLRQSFRLLPQPKQSPNLKLFLEADGLTPDELLHKLPYEAARAGGGDATVPDPKRYRDPRQVYQTIGLFYEREDGLIRVTELGKATLRWMDKVTPESSPVLGGHAAFALAACQLRNPTRSGSKYDPSMDVFPFSFIWRAMLALDDKLSSDEVNRSLLKVKNEQDLAQSIKDIATARAAGDVALLGPETVSGPGKNDRIIPWMSMASFGWLLFSDKKSGIAEASDYYELFPRTRRIVKAAAALRHRHREFQSVPDYIEYISACAGLPEDLR